MEKWRTFIAGGALAWSAPVLAQDAPVPTQAAEPAVTDDLALGAIDDRMTVPVEIAGAGPYPFIIDTGAQRSVVSRQLAARLGLPRGRRVRLTAMSGTTDVDTVIVPSIAVTPATRNIGGRLIEAPALDARHLGASGLLGIDTLQEHAVVIDFDKQKMSVASAKRRNGRRIYIPPNEIVVRAKSLFGQLVVTDARIGGRRVRVVLDTGTAVSMGNAALRALLSRRRATGQARLTSVTGGVVTADYAIVRGMKLGAITIDDLPVAFAEVAPFRAFGLEDRPALLLGMDALRLFRRVDIDFANRELRLALPRNVRTS